MGNGLVETIATMTAADAAIREAIRTAHAHDLSKRSVLLGLWQTAISTLIEASPTAQRACETLFEHAQSIKGQGRNADAPILRLDTPTAKRRVAEASEAAKLLGGFLSVHLDNLRSQGREEAFPSEILDSAFSLLTDIWGPRHLRRAIAAQIRALESGAETPILPEEPSITNIPREEVPLRPPFREDRQRAVDRRPEPTAPSDAPAPAPRLPEQAPNAPASTRAAEPRKEPETSLIDHDGPPPPFDMAEAGDDALPPPPPDDDDAPQFEDETFDVSRSDHDEEDEEGRPDEIEERDPSNDSVVAGRVAGVDDASVEAMEAMSPLDVHDVPAGADDAGIAALEAMLALDAPDMTGEAVDVLVGPSPHETHGPAGDALAPGAASAPAQPTAGPTREVEGGGPPPLDAHMGEPAGDAGDADDLLSILDVPEPPYVPPLDDGPEEMPKPVARGGGASFKPFMTAEEIAAKEEAYARPALPDEDDGATDAPSPQVPPPGLPSASAEDAEGDDVDDAAPGAPGAQYKPPETNVPLLRPSLPTDEDALGEAVLGTVDWDTLIGTDDDAASAIAEGTADPTPSAETSAAPMGLRGEVDAAGTRDDRPVEATTRAAPPDAGRGAGAHPDVETSTTALVAPHPEADSASGTPPSPLAADATAAAVSAPVDAHRPDLALYAARLAVDTGRWIECCMGVEDDDRGRGAIFSAIVTVLSADGHHHETRELSGRMPGVTGRKAILQSCREILLRIGPPGEEETIRFSTSSEALLRGALDTSDRLRAGIEASIWNDIDAICSRRTMEWVQRRPGMGTGPAERCDRLIRTFMAG